MKIRPHLRQSSAFLRLASDGAVAAMVKLAGAGLTYVMFIAMARITGESAFGYFASAFALASLLAFAGSLGQQSAILRFWPEWEGRGDTDAARSFLLLSVSVGAIGLIVVAAALCAAAYLYDLAVGRSVWFAFGASTALLLVALGWAEVLSSALRAQGRLLLALLPKEVLWRFLAIAAAWACGFVWGRIGAVEAVLLAGTLLILVLLPQTVILVVRAYLSPRKALEPKQKAEFRSVTLGLWGVTALNPAIAHGVSLVVLAILGPVEAGAFFAAQRSALLISVALAGLNQVLAPQISRAYYRDEKQQLQHFVSLGAAISASVGLLGLIFFAIFGRCALGLFDPGFATHELWIALMVLMVGQLFNAMAGPTSILLQLTGKQHTLLNLLIVSNAVGVIIIVSLVYFAGTIGAAVGASFTSIVWNALAIYTARRDLGIDPSMFGMARR
ncbi:O-antigen/teichoic acid export membrane protein [Mesorhizobium sp. J18]|uniref:lipopolysaccharide biosynthesis protein n=1 Tax=Mesorhizobium sp. J18 TaxID=935263 RepID=UPI00119B2C3C|nr:lipopolysaccharide biosynthesis protein [Mesorhizobium sp. J18]TWH01318.1 O-antigen/teichoic acid export membrane protein [Mesorhizobium sp. J18]